MQKISMAVNSTLQNLHKMFKGGLWNFSSGEDLSINAPIIQTPKQIKLANYFTKINKSYVKETDDFLSLVKKAEKQEGYILDSIEFKELLEKVKIADREKLKPSELFIRVDDFVVRRKAKHINKLRKKSEGVQKHAQDEYPKELEPEIKFEQRKLPWVPKPEKGEVYPNLVSEKITQELENVYKINEKVEKMERQAEIAVEEINKQIAELRQKAEDIKSPFTKKQVKLNEQLAEAQESLKVTGLEELPKGSIQKWHNMLVAHLEHFNQVTEGRISRQDLAVKLIEEYGDKMQQQIESAMNLIVDSSRTVAESLVVYPETQKRKELAVFDKKPKTAGIWEKITSAWDYIIDGLKNVIAFFKGSDEEISQIDEQLTEIYQEALAQPEEEVVEEEIPEEQPVAASLNKQAKVVKLDSGKYQVQSEKGKNLGTYSSEKEAKERLKDVEFFKHKKANRKALSNKDIDYKEITQEEWDKLSEHDYTSVIDGNKYILDHDEETSGTTLRPVRIIGEDKKILSNNDIQEESENKETITYDDLKKIEEYSPEEQKQYEEIAGELFEIERNIFDALNITSANPIRDDENINNKYLDMVIEKVPERIPAPVYKWLEESNVHTLNAALVYLDLFEPFLQTNQYYFEEQEEIEASKNKLSNKDIQKKADIQQWFTQFQSNLNQLLSQDNIDSAKEWVRRNWENIKGYGMEWAEKMREYINMLQPPEVSQELLSVMANRSNDFIRKAGGGYPNSVDKCRWCVWFNVDNTLDGNSGFFGRCANCIHAYTEDELNKLKDEDKAEVKDFFQDRATSTKLVFMPGYETKKANLKKKAEEKADLEKGIEIEREHKPTLDKIKKDVEEDGKLDMPDEEVYKGITQDHLREHPDYYDEKKGLPAMEKNLEKDRKALSSKDNLIKKKSDGGGDEATHILYEVKCPKCGKAISITPGEKALSSKVYCDKCKMGFEPKSYAPKSLKDKALADMDFSEKKDERMELDKIRNTEGVEYKEKKDDKKDKKKKKS